MVSCCLIISVLCKKAARNCIRVRLTICKCFQTTLNYFFSHTSEIPGLLPLTVSLNRPQTISEPNF